MLKEILGRDMVFYVAIKRCVGWDTLGHDIDFLVTTKFCLSRVLVVKRFFMSQQRGVQTAHKLGRGMKFWVTTKFSHD